MRGRRTVLATLVVCVLSACAGVSAADASKGVVSYFGNPGTTAGTLGGEFNVPRGVAVNDSTIVDASDGAIYVVDDNNHRIQKFSASGAFLRAWGRDVDTGGGVDFEICTVAASCKAASPGTTTDGPAGELDNPQSIAVDQADGSVYVVDRDNRRIQKFDADGNFLRTWGKDVDTAVGTGFEVCTVAANCKIGVSGALGGEFGTTFSGAVAVVPAGAPNAGNVLVTDPANRRVQEFTSAGAFVRTFGFDVAGPAAGADNTGTGFEICTQAVAGAANCKIGATVTAPVPVGAFPANQPTRVAADSTGAIYTVESATSFRVQKFTPQAGPPALSPSVFADPVLTGTSTANTPTDVAVGAGNNVFVVKAFAAGTGTPNPAVSNERRVLELSSAGSLVDTHMAGATINSVNGLAVRPSNGSAYVSSQSYGSPTVNAQRVYVLDDVTAPTVTIAPADGITARGATFHGQINPGGVPSSYRFEYSEDGSSWTELPLIDAGSGNTNVPATQTVANQLKPNTLYQVRLVGKLNWGFESSTSASTSFMTAPAAPAVASVTAIDVTDTAATLTGRVNPNSQATTYRFDYGLTDSYGASVPVPNGSAGDGSVPVRVEATIDDLQPGTTYHFRLVATSVSGTTEGADHTFVTAGTASGSCANERLRQGVGAHLPDCRAYEQVSPVDKNGSDVVAEQVAVSANGEAALYRAFGAFAGSPTGGGGLRPDNYYYAQRSTSSGWSTTPAMPRSTTTTQQRDIFLVSPDLRTSLLFPNQHAFEPDTPPAVGSNLYLRDNDTGATSFLVNVPETQARGFDGSADLGHIAFNSQSVLVDEVPPLPPSGFKVYEIVGGQTRLVSRQPGTNAPFASEASLAGLNSGYTSNASSASGAGSVSEDGSRIFFETPADIGGPSSDSSLIYRRSDGATTELASPSQRVPADPQGPKRKTFRAATPDGNHVLFTSSELLTDDANTGPSRGGSDLYRYDMSTDELRDISATPGGDGARVQGVVGVSHDGDRVYYVAQGAVAPGAVAGDFNLYLWQEDGSSDGSTRFVGALDGTSSPGNPGDLLNWATANGFKAARTTVDGRFLLIESRASLTGYPNAGTSQVYRYDAEADGGDGELLCISCNPSGNSPAGSSRVPRTAFLSRAMSADGKYVFFDSDDAIVSSDTNGETDPYVWSDGEISLLSTGKSSRASTFYDASADGHEAFFVTREALVPQDVDANVDLYAASIGGGLDSQQAEAAPECRDDECQGPGSAAPPPGNPASSGFHGAGDLIAAPPAKSCAPLARKVTRAKRNARKLGRAVRRTSGQHQKRVKARHKLAKKRVKSLQRRVRQCKGGAK